MVKVVLLCFILTRFGSINSSFVSLCQAAAAADSLLPVLGKKKVWGRAVWIAKLAGSNFPRILCSQALISLWSPEASLQLRTDRQTVQGE